MASLGLACDPGLAGIVPSAGAVLEECADPVRVDRIDQRLPQRLVEVWVAGSAELFERGCDVVTGLSRLGDARVDEGSEESFPASGPPAY